MLDLARCASPKRYSFFRDLPEYGSEISDISYPEVCTRVLLYLELRRGLVRYVDVYHRVFRLGVYYTVTF